MSPFFVNLDLDTEPINYFSVYTVSGISDGSRIIGNSQGGLGPIYKSQKQKKKRVNPNNSIRDNSQFIAGQMVQG